MNEEYDKSLTRKYLRIESNGHYEKSIVRATLVLCVSATAIGLARAAVGIGEIIRFNDLYDSLLESFDITKPTLSKHLKHLKREGLVVRTVEDAQKVSYEVDHARLKDFIDAMKSAQIIQTRSSIEQMEKGFEAASFEEQINVVFGKMALRSLRYLRTWIEFESNHIRNIDKWEKSVESQLLNSSLFKYYDRLLVAKCTENEDYKTKVLREIDETIEAIEDMYRLC